MRSRLLVLLATFVMAQGLAFAVLAPPVLAEETGTSDDGGGDSGAVVSDAGSEVTVAPGDQVALGPAAIPAGAGAIAGGLVGHGQGAASHSRAEAAARGALGGVTVGAITGNATVPGAGIVPGAVGGLIGGIAMSQVGCCATAPAPGSAAADPLSDTGMIDQGAAPSDPGGLQEADGSNATDGDGGSGSAVDAGADASSVEAGTE
jgi:hypothetical protein